jgi:histidine triad (HIT) family protein
MATLFEKIIAREIPSDIVHETEDAIVFRDINPKAPVHVLAVPKKVIPRIALAGEDDALILGKVLLAAAEAARKLGLEETGYRLAINNGKDAGEAVPHLHVHVLGGRALKWPPG